MMIQRLINAGSVSGQLWN